MNDCKLVPVEPEMLPCPFCGGTDALVERQDNCSAYVVCSSMLDEHSCCYAQGPVGIQEDDGEEIPGATAAIAAWNQRAAPAVQGEPVAWSGWGCQYPGKMPRLYGERRIAELNCDWENGDQLLNFTAAPQPAEQQPAPDVEGLVEALEGALSGRPLDTEFWDRCEQFIAAHRKQGGEAPVSPAARFPDCEMECGAYGSYCRCADESKEPSHDQ